MGKSLQTNVSCLFGLLPNVNLKGSISSINIGFICLAVEDSTPMRPRKFKDCMAVLEAEKNDYSVCSIYKSNRVFL